MSHKAAISLTTGLEDAEKVTVAFLVAVGAAEAGRDTLMFLTKEAVRLAVGARRWATSWHATRRREAATSRAACA
jgi:predicted peroxiredoxin